MTKPPAIFTALQFYIAASGKYTYHTHYVAADSFKKAVAALHEAGVSGKALFLVIDPWRSSISNVIIEADRMRVDEIDEAEFVRWVRSSTSPSYDSGDKYPPTWARVPEALRVAA